MIRHQYGKESESRALSFLQTKGYRIIERNYTSHSGEIDIICLDRDCIVFIEVKARKSLRFGHPKISITERKKKRMSMVALEYLKKTKQLNKRARFDVVSIDNSKQTEKIELIKNAFDFSY